MNTFSVAVAAFAFAAGFLFGWLISFLWAQKRLAELSTTLDLERKTTTGLKETFASLSHQALRLNNESFIQLAKETLGQFQVGASGDLDKRQHAIESMIQPVKESLEKFD